MRNNVQQRLRLLPRERHIKNRRHNPHQRSVQHKPRLNSPANPQRQQKRHHHARERNGHQERSLPERRTRRENDGEHRHLRQDSPGDRSSPMYPPLAHDALRIYRFRFFPSSVLSLILSASLLCALCVSHNPDRVVTLSLAKGAVKDFAFLRALPFFSVTSVLMFTIFSWRVPHPSLPFTKGGGFFLSTLNFQLLSTSSAPSPTSSPATGDSPRTPTSRSPSSSTCP